MTVALLSLGSNMGDSRGLLGEAVHALGDCVRAISSVYRTAPWGGVEQDDFLNIAVLVDDPSTDAHGWLTRCHQLEEAAHRKRVIRWGPRTLDVDVICVWRDGRMRPVDALMSQDPALTLPHPRAHERGFVLVPWMEIVPGAELPGGGSVAALAAALDTSDVVRDGSLNLAPAQDAVNRGTVGFDSAIAGPDGGTVGSDSAIAGPDGGTVATGGSEAGR